MALVCAWSNRIDHALASLLERFGGEASPRAYRDPTASRLERCLIADWLFSCYLFSGGVLCIAWTVMATSPRGALQWAAVLPLQVGGFALGRAATLALSARRLRRREPISQRVELGLAVAVSFCCLVAGSLVAGT